MIKKIFIILPYKESLKSSSSGAVSIYVKDTLKFSKYRKKTKIISSEQFKKKSIFTNKNYILDFCKKYQKTKIDIIEIHNRPEYLNYIKDYFPNTKIKIYFHNDPLQLRRSESVKDREYIISNTEKIIFLSRWIQQMFYSGMKNLDLSQIETLPVGVNKKNIDLKKKKKNILFVGKLNKAKGYHIFCDVASKFKKYDSTWNFFAIGNEARKEIFPQKNSVIELGYLKNKEVLDYYEQSEIAIGNSVWNEPLGRIAIEASSRKCFPIITNKAGFAESKKIAHVLKTNTVIEIVKLLKKITTDKKYRQNKQNLFYKNNNFELKKLSKKLDEIRDELIINKKRINYQKSKKILHIANLNENSDGRLFYSFVNKLNNGFIKNNHVVENINSRFYYKSNKPFFNFLNENKKFNEKILNTLKNFSPDLVLIGHVFNIDQNIFDYCKKKNIKICSWYIDSISNEFFNGDRKKNFLRNLEYIDNCFITSSPKIFKDNKHYKKIKFIPNPVDKAIDNLKNYKYKNLEFDIISATSHGQNRGILKKGKFDEREEFIKDLYDELPNIKFALFGINQFEPIWGVNFFYNLSKSKMALNISRGVYQKLYSSDRISSLIGNGLLVFIDKKTEFIKLFNNNEVVFYNRKKDLINKIKFYALNDNKRINLAKAAYIKYHKYMNNLVVSNYILNISGLIKCKKPFWHNKV
jgi:hypothetical protein